MTSTITKKLTPVLMVESIEPCLPLWVDKLGWTKTVDVPDGDKLGFVILAKDGAELMYQTWSSVEKDIGRTMPRPQGVSVGLFVEVTDLNDVEQQLAGEPITLPRRRTFYGMDELGVTEAGGHMVIFAQPAQD